MNILFLGDISGRLGREVTRKYLPDLTERFNSSIVIANCENAAGGRAVSTKIIEELQSYGVDYFTAGEHVWDDRNFILDMKANSDLPISRPYNYEGGKSIPGSSIKVYDIGSGQRLILVVFLGNVYMRDSYTTRNPFWMLDNFFNDLSTLKADRNKDIIIVDFHAEATAEKKTFGHELAGKVTAVLGTHTHVGTIDTQILDGQTAYVSDVGMCGTVDASLWATYSSAVHNYKYPFRRPFEMKLEGKTMINAVNISCEFGYAKSIERADYIES